MPSAPSSARQLCQQGPLPMKQVWVTSGGSTPVCPETGLHCSLDRCCPLPPALPPLLLAWVSCTHCHCLPACASCCLTGGRTVQGLLRLPAAHLSVCGVVPLPCCHLLPPAAAASVHSSESPPRCAAAGPCPLHSGPQPLRPEYPLQHRSDRAAVPLTVFVAPTAPPRTPAQSLPRPPRQNSTALHVGLHAARVGPPPPHREAPAVCRGSGLAHEPPAEGSCCRRPCGMQLPLWQHARRPGAHSRCQAAGCKAPHPHPHHTALSGSGCPLPHQAVADVVAEAGGQPQQYGEHARGQAAQALGLSGSYRAASLDPHHHDRGIHSGIHPGMLACRVHCSRGPVEEHLARQHTQMRSVPPPALPHMPCMELLCWVCYIWRLVLRQHRGAGRS
mmetsp:Transcript_3377/g.7387  ORF Transcript_3377/g.7387 Transcript_3377/m.7387 type:complete len:389 (-) Transcript_3377:343-1509(-)